MRFNLDLTCIIYGVNCPLSIFGSLFTSTNLTIIIIYSQTSKFYTFLKSISAAVVVVVVANTTRGLYQRHLNSTVLLSLVCSSVASFFGIGGGGARPLNVPTKKVLILRERAPQKHIFFRTKNTSAYIPIQSMQFPLITYGMALLTSTAKTLTIRKIYEYASERSERA